MALYVTAVDENSPAERFGLTVGCALLAIDGHPLNDALDYQFIQRPPRSPWKCVRTSSTAPYRSPRRSMSAGLQLQDLSGDEKHSCANHCMFCFIRPAAARYAGTALF